MWAQQRIMIEPSESWILAATRLFFVSTKHGKQGDGMGLDSYCSSMIFQWKGQHPSYNYKQGFEANGTCTGSLTHSHMGDPVILSDGLMPWKR